MKLFNFHQDNLNEVIFENRNKNYGAYQLRAEESNILQKALFFGVSAFITLAAIPLIVNMLSTKPIIDEGITDLAPINIMDVYQKDPVKPEPVKIEQTRPDVKVANTQLPTPTKFVKEEKTIATKSEMKDAAPGFDTKDGKDTKLNIVVPDIKVPVGPKVQDPKPFVKPVDDNVIVNTPDVEAKFPGGINAFRNQVGKYFDQSNFDGTGELMKTNITFVVEKDGSISNIKADGKDKYFNAEALKTINKINVKWIPAQVKGKNVRYSFKMPISMQFD